jgi:hypothetical protein
MAGELAANVVIGTIQVVIGILALMQRGGIFRRYRLRGVARRRSKSSYFTVPVAVKNVN